MLIRMANGWELPDSAVTPEAAWLDRRTLMRGAAAGSILAAGAPFAGAVAAVDDPSAHLYPAKRNGEYSVEREITPEAVATTFNNFYEFGSSKDIWREAQAQPLRPWQVRIDGLVEQPKTLDIDELLQRVALEERVYRHRCVERWSMVAPWTGFPMRALVEMAAPLSSAKYVRMESYFDANLVPRNMRIYPWPYVEGLTIAEATNELAFLVTGAYGKPLEKQNGAPLRLAAPWKYGFKSGKSLVRFSFTDERPENFWQTVNAREYGFWANVNPDVAHPRWSQKIETELHTGEKLPTSLYNGYGPWVADLYSGMSGEQLFV